MTIKELTKKVNNFVKNIDKTVAEIVNHNDDLEELNRKQLKQGKDGTGKKIGPPYSPGYAAWKSRFYPASYTPGIVNLFLTGKFYENLDIEARGAHYQILSPVPYSAELVAKYGFTIYNIAPENQPKAKKITTKALSNEFKKAKK